MSRDCKSKLELVFPCSNTRVVENVVPFSFCFILIFIQIIYFTNAYFNRIQSNDRKFDRKCDILYMWYFQHVKYFLEFNKTSCYKFFIRFLKDSWIRLVTSKKIWFTRSLLFPLEDQVTPKLLRISGNSSIHAQH